MTSRATTPFSAPPTDCLVVTTPTSMPKPLVEPMNPTGSDFTSNPGVVTESVDPFRAGRFDLDTTVGKVRVSVKIDDALAWLQNIPTGSIDAVVTDPPYAIRAADSTRSHMVSDHDESMPPRASDFAATSMLGQQSANWHEKATHSRGYADNNPVLFQQWCELWAAECLRVLRPGGHLIAFGGTRTWHRVAVAVENVGFEVRDSLAWLYATGFPKSVNVERAVAGRLGNGPVEAEVAGRAEDWAGWGTALKPAHEPIVLARKRLDGTVADTVLRHGTGALNLGACRPAETLPCDMSEGLFENTEDSKGESRWPANVIMDEAQGHVLTESVGVLPARYFWVPKPGATERVVVNGVSHPTVKPLELMRQLVRLVTRPGGTVLEPFAGSGTTVEACVLEGRSVLAVEREAIYLPLIEQRILRRTDPVRSLRFAGQDAGLFMGVDERPKEH